MLRAIVNWFFLRLFGNELESTVYPTRERMRLMAGIFLLIHIGFGTLLHFFWPQAYEPVWLRLLLAAVAALLLYATYTRRHLPVTALQMFSFVLWINLAWYFCHMYIMNGYNSVWLSALCGSVACYFLIQEWRGVFLSYGTGAFAAILTANWAGMSPVPMLPPMHLATLVVVVMAAIVHLLTMVSLREVRLRQSLAVVEQAQAHLQPALQRFEELVPRLRAAAALSAQVQPGNGAARLETMARKLGETVHGIHSYLERQQSNAQLFATGAAQTQLTASALIEKALAQYPYTSTRARLCVQLQVQEDFQFRGSEKEWLHVLGNLLQNAMDALVHSKLHLEPGDLQIRVQKQAFWGRIAIIDRGIGIAARDLPHVFEPFYTAAAPSEPEDELESTPPLMQGVGLGLAYCRQIVSLCGGRITVDSNTARGTRILLFLPIDQA